MCIRDRTISLHYLIWSLPKLISNTTNCIKHYVHNMVCAGTEWFWQGQQRFLQGRLNFFGRDTPNFKNICNHF